MHEAMHQWDGEMFGALRVAAANATVPSDLIWKPWLEGRGTRDAALAVLVPRAAAVSQP